MNSDVKRCTHRKTVTWSTRISRSASSSSTSRYGIFFSYGEGHMGLIISFTPATVTYISGNTSASNGTNSNGGEVAIHTSRFWITCSSRHEETCMRRMVALAPSFRLTASDVTGRPHGGGIGSEAGSTPSVLSPQKHTIRFTDLVGQSRLSGSPRPS